MPSLSRRAANFVLMQVVTYPGILHWRNCILVRGFYFIFANVFEGLENFLSLVQTSTKCQLGFTYSHFVFLCPGLYLVFFRHIYAALQEHLYCSRVIIIPSKKIRRNSYFTEFVLRNLEFCKNSVPTKYRIRNNSVKFNRISVLRNSAGHCIS